MEVPCKVRNAEVEQAHGGKTSRFGDPRSSSLSVQKGTMTIHRGHEVAFEPFEPFDIKRNQIYRQNHSGPNESYDA